MDRFEELVWPAFVKYCSENEYIFNHDNVTKNVVQVADATVQLRKGIRGGREVWVTVDKEFAKIVFQGIMGTPSIKIDIGNSGSSAQRAIIP